MNIRESLLPKLSVNRPITVIMCFLALLVVGVIAYTQIPIELLPKGFVPPFLGVWVPYNNASPQEIEEQIAKPVEEILQTVSGVRKVSSFSSSNGCWVWLEFGQATNMEIAYADVRDRMDRVKGDLPDDIDRIFVRKFSDDDDPIVYFAIVLEDEFEDPYYLVDQFVKRRLERIDGVANVELWGVAEKEILIYVDQEKVKAHKINMFQLVGQLRQENFTLTSGYIEEGTRKIYVRSLGKFATLQQIGELPIKGTNIHLKDIATVSYEVPKVNWIQRVNRRAAIRIGVFKESMANTVEVGDVIVGAIENDFKKEPKLKGMSFHVLFDQGTFIRESIDNLKTTGMWGGMFAFIIIFSFLRRIRMTFVINLAIPISLMITVIFLYFFGWTLNIITMMGLMISIGLVVDNSIVIVENIYRLKQKGLKPQKASIGGASEVGLAVTMATLTTVVVFLPLMLMNDDIGMSFYMYRIGLPVVAALVGSLFVALLFVPLATTRLDSGHAVKEPKTITKSIGLYSRMLNWTLSHRVDAVIIVLIIMMSIAYPMSNMKTADETNSNINDFRLMFDLPPNFTIEKASKLLTQVEDFLYENKEKYKVETVDTRYSSIWGQIRVFMVAKEKMQWYDHAYINIKDALNIGKRDLTRTEIVEDVKENMPSFPGVKVRTSWRNNGSGEGVQLTLFGDDTSVLIDLSEEVERRLLTIPEIIGVETDAEKGEDEIKVYVKRTQARKYGINPQQIASTISYALRGIQLPKYQTEDKEITIRLQLTEEDRENLHQLKNLTFIAQNGKEIPLSALATFRFSKGMGRINRRDGKTSLSLTVKTTEEDLGLLYQKIDAVMVGFTMPRGYEWAKGGSFTRMRDSNNSQKFAMIMAITFVFLLMGVLFESFILPLSVIISIPLSFFGAFWLLYLTNTPFELMAGIGLIILIGIVVNNAIVLIDMINRYRLEGYDRKSAILEAGRHRFRPILMTAFTTIFGLLPMAIGGAEMIGISYAPMGRTMIGGMISSTFLTLLVVPLLYTLFDDLRIVWKRLMEQTFAKPGKRTPPEKLQPVTVDLREKL